MPKEQLRVGAAVGVGSGTGERIDALVEAGVDIIAEDSALDTVEDDDDIANADEIKYEKTIANADEVLNYGVAATKFTTAIS
jgi:putative N-acetylmannosamine-6-phosphate epimerase